MKKIFALVITFALVLGMAACSKPATPGPSTTSPSPTLKTPTTSSPSTTPTSPSPSKTSPSSSSKSPSSSSATPSKSAMAGYKDGTFSAKGDPWSKGQEEAVVTIKGGKIADINLKRLNSDGKTEVDYNLFDGKVHNGTKYPDIKDFRVTMAKNMIEKQSAKVDTIAGASTTTKNWTIAAQRALDQAKK